MASALVRRGVLSPNEITGLDILVRPENLKEGFRAFLPDGGQRGLGYVYKMAVQLRAVAQHHVKVEPTQLRDISAMVARLSPSEGRAIGKRNRERLKPFDDAAVVQCLLQFPEEEFTRAMRLKNPLGRAKGVERALAIALLL